MPMTSTIVPSETLLLQKDTRGRIRMPAERRQAILDEFERCGMSGAAFAKHHGIKYQTFASWRQKLRRDRVRSAADPKPLALTEVVVNQSARTAGREAGLRIELPGGATLHIHQPVEARLAAAVLAALAERGSGC